MSDAGSGFYVFGTTLPATITAGSAVQNLEIVPNVSAAGANLQSLTLVANDVNATGYSAALPDETLTVTDTVVAGAVGLLNTGTVVLPNVRAGAQDMLALGVTNTATGIAANLDASVQAYGDATAVGSIAALAPGAADSSDLTVGVVTNAAGSISGSVTVAFASDLGNGVTVAVSPMSTVAVSGLVYREATAQVAIPHLILHVGDNGVVPVTVSNTAVADGYSEDLITSSQ